MRIMSRGSLQRVQKPKSSVPNPCSVCGLHIYGSLVGTGDGTMKNGGSFAHPECYWRDIAKTLEAALKAITVWSVNGRQLCFRSSGGIPMGMTPKLERIARRALLKSGGL